MSWLVTLAGSTRQLITFEGSPHVIMAPEELEELEAKLAAVTAKLDNLRCLLDNLADAVSDRLRHDDDPTNDQRMALVRAWDAIEAAMRGEAPQ